MVPDAYRELFDMLASKTKHGEVNWARSPREGAYTLSFADFSLAISEGVDSDDGRPFVSLRLINDQGRDADGFWVSAGEPYWDEAQELFAGARRKANRIDETLRKLMDELGKPGPVGEPPEPEEQFPF